MVTVFLPCREGSQRVPFKNTKPFSGIKGGLLEMKLKELIKVPSVNKIFLSTNDPKVIEIARNINSNKIVIDIREDYLSSSSTSTDDLINYVPEIIEDDHILWTHVTSPFITADIYESIIKEYFKKLAEGFDSLMTVNKIQTFLWNEKGSINYDRNIEKWPRTQTLPKTYEVNSGVFINSLVNYSLFNDRIGEAPFLYETLGYTSFDIDWPEDFLLAELIYKSLNE
jgi:CMP-N-acetylneuraminic acid synthetase